MEPRPMRSASATSGSLGSIGHRQRRSEACRHQARTVKVGRRGSPRSVGGRRGRDGTYAFGPALGAAGERVVKRGTTIRHVAADRAR